MRTGVKLFVGVGLVCLWLLLTISGIIQFPEIGGIIKDMAHLTKSSDKINWKTVNLYSIDLPESAKEAKNNVVISQNTVKVMDVKVFYREAKPPDSVTATGQSVLLLHGRSFSSETWEKIETLRLLAALGYRVIAVDLPGYGNTHDKLTGDRGEFLLSLLQALDLLKSRPVVVSPSMSGEYSVTFLKEHSSKLAGYIPVAPVATNSVPPSVLEKIQVPTLIVYGSEDNTGLAEAALKNLKVMPNSREVKLEQAGHPAYLNQPDVFHKLVYNFMLLLK
ncbi:putative protein-lysine deacylase ABHD14B [Anabrus simplex]|uniref:putative protein-lysine deacylase ABHD14B n=1 Tax=Anabrus simplex TaxID=316456 RepID=UPI0034DDC3AF